jgi:hypothetical protein
MKARQQEGSDVCPTSTIKDLLKPVEEQINFSPLVNLVGKVKIISMRRKKE